MQNVEVKISKDGILTATVDLNTSLRRSRGKKDKDGKVTEKGKNVLIASTGGNVALITDAAPGLKMGLNLFRPILAADSFDDDGNIVTG